MSKTTSQINYTVSATDAGAGATFARVGNQVQEMNRKAAAAQKGVLDNLKSSFGEESTFGRIGKLLTGAGAIAGFTVAGRLLNNSVDAAAKLAGEFERGEISVSKMVGELAKGLPIFGQFVDAGWKLGVLLDRQGARLSAEQSQRQDTNDITGNRTTAMMGAFSAVADKAKPSTDPMQLLQGRVNAARDLVKKANEEALGALENQLAAEREALRKSYKDEEDQIIGRIAGLEGRKVALANHTREALLKVEGARIAEEARLRREEQIAKLVDAAKAESEAINARRATQKKIEQLAAEARAESEGINRKRRRLFVDFGLEDREDFLGGRKKQLEDAIREMEKNRPRRGALADAETDLGRGAALAAMERRSSDPGTKVLTESKRELTKINEQLKSLNDAVKQRQRTSQLGESIFD